MTSYLFYTIRNPDPARPFIEMPDGRTMSYGELFEGAGRFTNALRTLGVDPDHQCERSWTVSRSAPGVHAAATSGTDIQALLPWTDAATPD